MNVISIQIGDTWGDGHGKSETIMFETDYSIEDVSNLNIKMVESFPWVNEMCREYEESNLMPDVVTKLKRTGIDVMKDESPYLTEDTEEPYQSATTLFYIMMRIFKVLDPNFTYKVYEPNLTLHPKFGYGVFY